jgi:hypothetical protein
MGKIFYTERDIEDMARRGEMTLVVSDNVVLTDLAYESARRLHVNLAQPHDHPPAAPVRPYLNQASSLSAAPGALQPSPRVDAIKERVHSAVKARLGNQVEDALLDRIIERVAADLGLR